MKVFDFAPLSEFDSDKYALVTTWSFAHFASGAALGLVVVLWRDMMRHELLLALALAALVGWEVLEWASGGNDDHVNTCCGLPPGFGAEHFLNRAMDIVIGLLGLIVVCFASGKF